MAARRKAKETPPASLAPVVSPPPPDPTPPTLARTPVGLPCAPEHARPMVVRAHLASGLVSVPMLDGLLAAVVARVEGLEPCMVPSEVVPIEIPLARTPCGRLHLCSAPVYREEAYEVRHRNRRFPMLEAQMLGDASMRRVNVAGGPTKSFRIPYQQAHLTDDLVLWYAVGDLDRVRDLLRAVGYLGSRRGVGQGKVRAWEVEPWADPWPGFPLLRAGRPLRPLPWGWPGVTEARAAFAVPSYPYWDQARRERCAVAEDGA